MGGKSSSSSQANQTTNNEFNDSRVTNRDGIVTGAGSALDLSNRSTTDASFNLSSWDASTKTSWADSSTMTNTNTNTNTTNNSVDAAITAQAFDFAKGNDATLGAGLSSILSFAKDLTVKNNENTSSLASQFGQGMVQAYDNARTTTAGGIDNKTMIVLGVAGAAALAFMASKKG